MYSQELIPGDTREKGEKTLLQYYMWQVYGLANILKMKLFSAYSKLGNSKFRNYYHRCDSMNKTDEIDIMGLLIDLS
jgi:hypothetical protein